MHFTLTESNAVSAQENIDHGERGRGFQAAYCDYRKEILCESFQIYMLCFFFFFFAVLLKKTALLNTMGL